MPLLFSHDGASDTLLHCFPSSPDLTTITLHLTSAEVSLDALWETSFDSPTDLEVPIYPKKAWHNPCPYYIVIFDIYQSHLDLLAPTTKATRLISRRARTMLFISEPQPLPMFEILRTA